jgi:dTDP-4-dehydrorhamnose reductase
VAGVLERSPKFLGIPSSEFPTRAKRPAYSRLDSSRFARDFDLRLPDWRVGLREVIGEIAEVRGA